MPVAYIATRALLVVGLLVGTACTPPHSDTADSASDHTVASGEADELLDNAHQAEHSKRTEPTADDNATSQSNTADQVSVDRHGSQDEVIDITFEDIALPIDKDMVFRPFMMTDRARELDGKRVRISGYMLADAELRGIKQFILLKNTECKFGPGGQADHLVNVKVNMENGAVYRTDPVSVQGVLTINPYTGFDGNTWSIFDLACDDIEKYTPRR